MKAMKEGHEGYERRKKGRKKGRKEGYIKEGRQDEIKGRTGHTTIEVEKGRNGGY